MFRIISHQAHFWSGTLRLRIMSHQDHWSSKSFIIRYISHQNPRPSYSFVITIIYHRTHFSPDEKCFWWEMILMRHATDENGIWWETNLIRNVSDEKWICCKMNLMRNDFDGGRICRGMLLMRSESDGKWIWPVMILMRNDYDEEWFRWEMSPTRNDSVEKRFWWEMSQSAATVRYWATAARYWVDLADAGRSRQILTDSGRSCQKLGRLSSTEQKSSTSPWRVSHFDTPLISPNWIRGRGLRWIYLIRLKLSLSLLRLLRILQWIRCSCPRAPADPLYYLLHLLWSYAFPVRSISH